MKGFSAKTIRLVLQISFRTYHRPLYFRPLLSTFLFMRGDFLDFWKVPEKCFVVKKIAEIMYRTDFHKGGRLPVFDFSSCV